MCRVADCTNVVLREEISSGMNKKTWKVGEKSLVTQMEVWTLKSSRRTQLGYLQTHLPKRRHVNTGCSGSLDSGGRGHGSIVFRILVQINPLSENSNSFHVAFP